MKQTLFIKGRLAGLNEYIEACRTNRYVGAKMKADAEELIRWEIKMQKLHPVKKKVRLKYLYVEPNMRRDQDNISGFAHKVIQDALVAEGILKNDGWKYIKGHSDDYAVDKDSPMIVVQIEEKE